MAKLGVMREASPHKLAGVRASTEQRGLLVYGRAMLAHALGRFSQAELHFQRALALEQALASPPLIAETSARFARMLQARAEPGDAERARKLFAQSGRLAQRFGLVLWQPAAATGSAA